VLRGRAEADIHISRVGRIVDIRIEDSRFTGIVVIAADEESFDLFHSNLIMWFFF